MGHNFPKPSPPSSSKSKFSRNELSARVRTRHFPNSNRRGSNSSISRPLEIEILSQRHTLSHFSFQILFLIVVYRLQLLFRDVSCKTGLQSKISQLKNVHVHMLVATNSFLLRSSPARFSVLRFGPRHCLSCWLLECRVRLHIGAHYWALMQSASPGYSIVLSQAPLRVAIDWENMEVPAPKQGSQRGEVTEVGRCRQSFLPIFSIPNDWR